MALQQGFKVKPSSPSFKIQILKLLAPTISGCHCTREELISYFASIGDYMSKEEAQRVILDVDNDGENSLEFKESVRLMEEGNEGDDIKRAFEMYEVDKGSGCITPVGLQQMLNRLGDMKSYEHCVAMIRVFDLDGNGVLDFHEFQQMMKGGPCKLAEVPRERE